MNKQSKISKKTKVRRSLTFKKILFAAVGVGIVGFGTLIISQASGFSISIEPEDPELSTLSGVTVDPDTNASGGQSIKFSSTATPGGCFEESTACTEQEGNSSGTYFRENFDFNPSSPESRVNNLSRWYTQPTMQSTGGPPPLAPKPMLAQHDSNCGRPASWTGGAWDGVTIPVGFHKVATFKDTIYSCKNHIMTAMNPGISGGTESGNVVMKPNHMIDLRNATEENPAVIKIDVSTLSPTAGDWWDIWVTPWDDQLVAPSDHHFHQTGPPKNGIIMKVRDSNPYEIGVQKKNWGFQYFSNYLPQISRMCNGGVCSGGTMEIADYQAVDIRPLVSVSDTRRDLYEVRMTKDNVKLFVQSPEDNQLHFVDEFDIPGGFPADAGVVQFDSAQYQPSKGGNIAIDQINGGTKEPYTIPATWHWDNAIISPAIEYTLINAEETIIRYQSESKTIHFKKAAPKNARMLFVANERTNSPKISFDNGATWKIAKAVRPPNDSGALGEGGPFDSLTYTIDVPEGQATALIDGSNSWTEGGITRQWAAQNFHIISRDTN